MRFASNVQTDQDNYHCSTSTRAGVIWERNVYGRGIPCGAADVVAPTGFRNPAKLDLRLSRRAAAIDHGDPRSFPRVDIEGQRRPKGRAPDAGADEAG